jgi:hypothetical protein
MSMDKEDRFVTDPKRVFRYSVRYGHRENRKRDVVLAVGMQLVVDPLMPQKMKHRGRVGRVTKIRVDYLEHPVSANVTFEDKLAGNWGVVDADDLRPPTDEETQALAQGQWPPRPAYELRPVTPDDGPRASALAKTSFPPEATMRRPPLEDVVRLWEAALELDAPQLAEDVEAQKALAGFRGAGDISFMVQSRVARWLPSYDALPCSWWGSAREASFYRLAVRAYEPDGSLAAIHALQTKWETVTKTGRAPQRTTTRWPRPWNTDGLLIADAAALSALRGEPASELAGILIAPSTWAFLGACADAQFLAGGLLVGALGCPPPRT